MASENKDIGDIVKNCKILLLDIEGTTSSVNFVKDDLYPYVEKNMKQFLDSQWDIEEVKAVVAALRKLALEDKDGSVEGVVAIPEEAATKEEQIEGVVNNVKWQMSFDRKAGPLKALQGLIWKQGYDSGDIKGHVYDDVSSALKQWRSVDGQKVYIYSSGSVAAQKLLFGQSIAGNLLDLLDGHFDTAVGPKQEAGSYKKIAEEIACKPEEILFLTDILKEAEAARSAGVQAALVSREGNAPLPEAVQFPVLRSFAELSVNNKRKQPTQEDATPAKILKTDAEEAASIQSAAPQPTLDTNGEKAEEKMETEDNVTAAKEELIVEEITDTKDIPVIENIETVVIEPVVIEEDKKTEGIAEVEMKPAKPADTDAKVDVPATEGIPAPPVAEETPPVSVVITEIEDVTEKLDEVEAMIVDDLKPVVEEPSAAELDELQNVGKVLEKECDEILSKVSSVTNLDNITIKPMLNSIAEETMETENADSNDIVDRILDTELEMEMKECNDTDIDPCTLTEMSDEIKADETTAAVPETITETSPQVNIVSEAKIETEAIVTEKEKEVSSTAETITEVTETEIPKDEEKTKEAEVTEVTENKLETIKEQAKPQTVTEETTPETITESKKPVTVTEEKKPITVTEEKKPVTVTEEKKPVTVTDEKIPETVMEEKKLQSVTEEKKPETVTEEKKPETVTDEKKPEIVLEEVKCETVTEETKLETVADATKPEDPKVNGKVNGDVEEPATNGKTNGDVNSRLAETNGKNGDENGANGASMETEQGQGDCKGVVDIKVKTVTSEEPRTDPVEQTTA